MKKKKKKKKKLIKPLTDDSKMPVGKLKGKKLRDVPSEYLLWLMDQDWKYYYPRLWKYLKLNSDLIKYEAEKKVKIRKIRSKTVVKARF